MPKHKIRLIRIFFLRYFPKFVNVTDYIFISIRFMKISMIFFILHRFSMSQMVMSDHVNSRFVQIFCKCIISVDKFDHTMT